MALALCFHQHFRQRANPLRSTPEPRQIKSAFEINNIQKGHVICCRDNIRLLQASTKVVFAARGDSHLDAGSTWSPAPDCLSQTFSAHRRPWQRNLGRSWGKFRPVLARSQAPRRRGGASRSRDACSTQSGQEQPSILATEIPGAKFVPLTSGNHIVVAPNLPGKSSVRDSPPSSTPTPTPPPRTANATASRFLGVKYRVHSTRGDGMFQGTPFRG
jgi:hypothetical protein